MIYWTKKKFNKKSSFVKIFEQTKYYNLIQSIDALAPIKFIIEKKKDENEILLIYEEIVNDLKKIGVNQEIHALEKKLMQDMNEETYKELLNLKKQANNG